MRQSMAVDNRDQIMKDLESLSLEKYIDEIAGAAVEGIARCKTEKDVWGAIEVWQFSFARTILISSCRSSPIYIAASRKHSPLC